MPSAHQTPPTRFKIDLPNDVQLYQIPEKNNVKDFGLDRIFTWAVGFQLLSKLPHPTGLNVDCNGHAPNSVS